MAFAPGSSKSIWNFDPRSIPGCALWLDASDIGATGGGATVSSWKDKSGFGSNATANSAITLTQNAMGGRPALSFNASTPQWLLGSTSITSNTLTVCAVFSMQSNSGAAARTVALAATGANDYNNNSYVGILRQNGTTMGPYRNGGYVGGSFSYATPVVSVSLFDGANAYLYTNGTAQSSYASTGNFAVSSYAIAANTNTADAHYFTGFIGEVIVYSSALTTVQRQQVEGYLAWKWLGGFPSTLQFTQLTGAGSKIWQQPSFSSNMQTGIAVQNGSGYIWTTTDGGVSWTQRLGPYYWYSAAISADGSTMYAGQYVNPGTPGYLYKSTDGGANWTWLSNAPGTAQVGIACSSNGTIVYTINNTSTAAVSTNGGSTWTSNASPGSSFCICCSLNGSIAYAATPYVYVTSNTGATWTTITSGIPAANYFGSACSADGTKAAVTRGNSNVYVSSNTGTSWSTVAAVSDLIQIRTYGLAMSSNGNTMYVFGGTSLYKTINFGVSWAVQSGLTTASGMYSDGGGIACSRDGSNVIVATNNSSTAGYLYKGTPGSSHPFYPTKPFLRTFQPTDIDGCALWLDANDATTLTLSGSNISSWADKSGNGNNANIVTATPPTYSSANKAVVFAAASAMGLRGNMSASLSNASVFVVASYTSNAVTPALPRLFGLGSNNSTENFLIGQFTLVNQPLSVVVTYVGNLSGNAFGDANYQSGGTISYATPFLYTNISTYSGSTFTNFTLVNGAAGTFASKTGTQATGSFYVGSANRYAIGNSMFATPGANGDSYNGNVYEVIVYPSALTTVQRQQVEGYLAKKWKLSTVLPATHPFVKIPPATTLPFSPLQITGCTLWLDANDPAGTGVQPSAGALATWTDKSGSSNHMTAAGTTPTFSNVPPGAVTFGGAGYYSKASAVFSNFYTAFFVYKQTAATGGPLYTTGASSGSNGLFPNESGTTYFTRGDSTWYSNVSSPFTSNVTNLAGVSFSSNVVGSNQSLFYNGSNVVTTTQANTITYTNLLIGSRQSGGTAYFTGSIYEVIAYNGTLTSNLRQRVEGYLAQKWKV